MMVQKPPAWFVPDDTLRTTRYKVERRYRMGVRMATHITNAAHAYTGTEWRKLAAGVQMLIMGPPEYIQQFETMVALVHNDEWESIADWLVNHSKTKLDKQTLRDYKLKQIRERLHRIRCDIVRKRSNFALAQRSLNRVAASEQKALRELEKLETQPL